MVLSIVALAVTAMFTITGCSAPAGSPESRYEKYLKQQKMKNADVKEQISELPDWFIKPPASDYAVYTVGSGRAGSLDMALTKATISAKRQLADRMAGELTEKIREFATEMGSVDNAITVEEMERVTANIINKIPVHGYQIAKKEVQAFRGSYQAYILLEYGDEEINKVLHNQLQRERNAAKDKVKRELFEQLEKQLTEKRS